MEMVINSRICVFGAASQKIDHSLKKEAFLLGKELARRNHPLIFGAGSEGIMGCLAEGVHSLGGKIYGIAPTWMEDLNNVSPLCDSFVLTKSMDERSAFFKEYSDAIIIAPGGFGTLDECFDILTLKKLNQFNKPLILFNSLNFYDSLLDLFDEFVEQKVISEDFLSLFDVATTVDEIFEILKEYDLSY